MMLYFGVIVLIIVVIIVFFWKKCHDERREALRSLLDSISELRHVTNDIGILTVLGRSAATDDYESCVSFYNGLCGNTLLNTADSYESMGETRVSRQLRKIDRNVKRLGAVLDLE